MIPPQRFWTSHPQKMKRRVLSFHFASLVYLHCIIKVNLPACQVFSTTQAYPPVLPLHWTLHCSLFWGYVFQSINSICFSGVVFCQKKTRFTYCIHPTYSTEDFGSKKKRNGCGLPPIAVQAAEIVPALYVKATWGTWWWSTRFNGFTLPALHVTLVEDFFGSAPRNASNGQNMTKPAK